MEVTICRIDRSPLNLKQGVCHKFVACPTQIFYVFCPGKHPFEQCEPISFTWLAKAKQGI